MSETINGNFEVVPDEEVEEIPALPSDETIFAFVHHRRTQLVKALTKGGKMPQDTKDQMVLLSALKDMDGAAVSRKRLQIDAGGNDVARANAALVANILRHVNHNANQSTPAPTGVQREIPKLGDEFPNPELLDGETATTLPQQSYATFMSKHAPQQDASSDDGSE